MRVTSARGWIALGAALAVVAGVILYGFFGTAATTVTGQGLFLPPGGLIQVQAHVAGTVDRVHVAEGDVIEPGDSIASLISDSGETVSIESRGNARVAEVLIDPGNVVAPGQEVATIEPLGAGGEESQTAILFFPAGEGKAIQPGMEVRISPSTAPSEQYGQILGTVSFVSGLPASPERLQFLVQNETLAAALGAGSVLEVDVELQTADTPSGLKWTSGEGPPFEISHGTLAAASVVIDEERPASQLFGDE